MPGALPAKVKKNRRTHAWILLASGRGALPIEPPQRKQRPVMGDAWERQCTPARPARPVRNASPVKTTGTATKIKVINKRLTLTNPIRW